MCFEFEYLYWAKLEEEARQRKEEEQRRQQLSQLIGRKGHRGTHRHRHPF